MLKYAFVAATALSLSLALPAIGSAEEKKQPGVEETEPTAVKAPRGLYTISPCFMGNSPALAIEKMWKIRGMKLVSRGHVGGAFAPKVTPGEGSPVSDKTIEIWRGSGYTVVIKNIVVQLFPGTEPVPLFCPIIGYRTKPEPPVKGTKI